MMEALTKAGNRNIHENNFFLIHKKLVLIKNMIKCKSLTVKSSFFKLLLGFFKHS